jgi:hypothetical protein
MKECSYGLKVTNNNKILFFNIPSPTFKKPVDSAISGKKDLSGPFQTQYCNTFDLMQRFIT